MTDQENTTKTEWVDMHIVDFIENTINDMDFHDLQSIVQEHYINKGYSVRLNPDNPSQVSVAIL